MKWAHLPVAGGLYDQSPELLEAFQLIFAERGEAEAEERKKQERETGKNQARSAQRSRASRPRR